ncbi:MAG: hypothetical protein AAGB48_08360 [Planctomycetota bacterium]
MQTLCTIEQLENGMETMLRDPDAEVEAILRALRTMTADIRRQVEELVGSARCLIDPQPDGRKEMPTVRPVPIEMFEAHDTGKGYRPWILRSDLTGRPKRDSGLRPYRYKSEKNAQAAADMFNKRTSGLDPLIA